MKKPTFRGILKSINNYIVFFLTVAFAVSCCMILFITTLADSMGITFTQANISTAAKLTFGNVALITLVFAFIDRQRRKHMVERPVKIITEATDKITHGDFSVRLKHIKGVGVDGFNEIVDAINKMTEELSGTETLRTDFIANVSHELKTPLAVVGNYAAMLQRSGLSEEDRKEYANSISEATQKLAQLITNILKLNKLENQQIFPQTQEYDLGEQLCGCLLGFEDAWEKKELQIESEIEDNVRIKSDPELLSLVWNNLISNAVKFTPSGGTIVVRLQSDESSVTVTISDTGCGMTPEIGRHIFEKFYQGDTSHATQGNGLGLALVKRVIDILDGEIGVQSVYGQGSSFTVRFKR